MADRGRGRGWGVGWAPKVVDENCSLHCESLEPGARLEFHGRLEFHVGLD